MALALLREPNWVDQEWQKKEQLLVNLIPEDQADAGGYRDGMPLQGGFEIVPEFILGEVFLEGVALRPDTILILGKLFAPGLVSQHDADHTQAQEAGLKMLRHHPRGGF